MAVTQQKMMIIPGRSFYVPTVPWSEGINGPPRAAGAQNINPDVAAQQQARRVVPMARVGGGSYYVAGPPNSQTGISDGEKMARLFKGTMRLGTPISEDVPRIRYVPERKPVLKSTRVPHAMNPSKVCLAQYNVPCARRPIHILNPNMNPAVTQERQMSIPVPWGQISVLAWGSCLDSPVLMVHCLGDNAASFIPLVRLLPKKFFYVAMELPGMGKSDRMPRGMMVTMYDLVSVINAVVKHFRWQNFAYVGHALGAILGKLYNHAIPNKISKLIELDPTEFMAIEPDNFAEWYNTYFSRYYENFRRFNKPKEKGEKYFKEKAVAAVMKGRGFDLEIANLIVRRCTNPTSDGMIRNVIDQRHNLIPPPAFSTDYVRAVFLKIPTPTLHIISSNSIKQNMFKNTAFLQNEANYPHRNYKCIEVEGSADIHIQKPEKVAPYVSQFLLGGLAALSFKAKL